MIKDILKKREPLVYACVLNDLKHRRLAHSYLLCGEVNPFKKDVAYLLAQSIIEDKDDFACEICDVCLRIKDNRHLDVLYIDGNDELIKKEAIDNLLEEFSKTAVEKSGKKVYIINNINNASTKVLNMILKFMEEPSNDNTYGIFISDNVNNLLETIVSRCERLDFKSSDYQSVKQEYLDNGYTPVDAYLLSEVLHEYRQDIKELYLTCKEYVEKTIENINDREYLTVIFMSEVYPDKRYKEIIDLYLKLIIKVLDDSIASKTTSIEEYDDILNKLKPMAVELLEVFMNGQGRLESNNSIDRKLLFDDICYQLSNRQSA